MHTHRFVYPEDLPENYNDGYLVGVCKCGSTSPAHGIKWAVGVMERFKEEVPYQEMADGHYYDIYNVE